MHQNKGVRVATCKAVSSLLLWGFDTMRLSETRWLQTRSATAYCGMTIWWTWPVITDSEAASASYKVGWHALIVWLHACEEVPWISVIMGSESSRKDLLRGGGPLGERPCPISAGRDVQLIMGPSWGQEMGFPFGTCPITTGSQAADWSSACLKMHNFCWRKLTSELQEKNKKKQEKT